MPPRKTKASRKPKEEHTQIAVRVDQWEARADASINHAVYEPQYALYLDDDDPVYQFDTLLEISGTATSPDARAGDTYDLTLYGGRSSSHSVNVPLKAMQERDDDNCPRYRTYRGQSYPVYRAPSGLALIDKIRGEPRWTIWVPAAPRFVSDVLMMLGQGRQLYLAIHERKAERRRWLQNLSIQTNDPAEEE